jgi:hypothetical protein
MTARSAFQYMRLSPSHKVEPFVLCNPQQQLNPMKRLPCWFDQTLSAYISPLLRRTGEFSNSNSGAGAGATAYFSTRLGPNERAGSRIEARDRTIQHTRTCICIHIAVASKPLFASRAVEHPLPVLSRPTGTGRALCFRAGRGRRPDFHKTRRIG